MGGWGGWLRKLAGALHTRHTGAAALHGKRGYGGPQQAQQGRRLWPVLRSFSSARPRSQCNARAEAHVASLLQHTAACQRHEAARAALALAAARTATSLAA